MLQAASEEHVLPSGHGSDTGSAARDLRLLDAPPAACHGRLPALCSEVQGFLGEGSAQSLVREQLLSLCLGTFFRVGFIEEDSPQHAVS